MKVGNDCGALVWKIFGRCSSGRKPVRRAWTSRLASQVPMKRGGAGSVRVRARGAGEVEQVAVALEVEALEERV